MPRNSGSILIIDDERSIRKTLNEILSYEGFKVDEAGDGEEGLKMFSEKNYDVVLCDIKMPKTDGIEFLTKAVDFAPPGSIGRIHSGVAPRVMYR